MPTVLFGLLLFLAPGVLNVDMYSGSLRLSLLVLILVGTFAVPALLIYCLFRGGYVQSMQLTTLADRRMPYFLTAFFYFFLAYLFVFKMEGISTAAPEIGTLIGSIAVSILLVGVISLSWQISAHGVGIGGVVGAVGGIVLKFGFSSLFLPFLGLVLLTGFVASARLKLNAHTPAQVGTGVALGITVSVLTVFWFI